MIDALPLLLGPEGYQISRSVRLRSSASAYFNRTPASAGNRQKWTYRVMLKRGAVASQSSLISARTDDNNRDVFQFQADATLQLVNVVGGSATTNLVTSAVYRDPSSFYDILLAVDTTQATASNRVKLYVNGVQVTAFSTATYPAQNANFMINAAVAHGIGRFEFSSPGGYYDGLFTEMYLIDGQQLDPSSFGETNPVTGVWQPKKYAGTYGTNGFYLNFSDNSAATAAAIGKDNSGNGNNWTPNNISVTAGVTYDSMLDVPTQWADGGNGRGNYAVLNPLLSAGGTTANGNLQVTTATGVGHSRATIAMPASGKWYAEFTAVSATTSTDYIFGIVGADTAEASYGYNQTPSYSYTAFGERVVNGTFTASFYSSYTTGDVIGCAVNLDANEITWYKNGTAQTAISITNGSYFWIVSDASGARQITAAFNAGQRPFSYTPPSGFKALNTLNLPTPTILKGNQYFNAVLYSGNSGSQSITGVGFQPDFVWGKSRNITENHGLFDAVRGVNKALYSNLTNAEATDPGVSAFNSDGFSLNGSTINATGYTYVAWNWKEGATQGFDIVTYTGNGAASQVVNHSLGVAPNFVIVKNRSASASWNVWGSQGFTRLGLNITNGDLGNFPITRGSSSITLPSTSDVGWNSNGNNYVAYLFAEVAGFSKFGSYTGNGSADGPFVFCGFRPRFVLVKRIDTTAYWLIEDASRSPYNMVNAELYPNDSLAESTDANGAYDFLSNGFKVRNAASANKNANGGTYIFAAFAENPLKFSLAR